ncbi:MAG: hypothetical protein IPI27_13660 [Betaproteobacteria bacterium]|nr:hypothetical protein [Betaproteobacteria bacterium]
MPRHSVILIEDVDAFFQQRSRADTGVRVSIPASSTRWTASPRTRARWCS